MDVKWQYYTASSRIKNILDTFVYSLLIGFIASTRLSLTWN